MLLRTNGLETLALTEEGEQTPLWQRTVFGGRVAARDLVLFSRQMAAMIRAGVTILAALQALIAQAPRSALSRLLQQVSHDIEAGESLSRALAKHPATFSPFFVGVVQTGEASGRLSESLEILSDYLERDYVFTRRLRAALSYPIFVLISVVIVVVLMMLFVVPQLTVLFAEARAELPLPTRLLLSTTEFLRDSWYIVLLIAAALAVLGRSYLRTPEGRYTVSSWALHVPFLGILFTKVYLSRLTSILHTLFKSDVPVLEALNIARGSIGSYAYQRILTDTANAVKDGAPISSVWEHERMIPQMLTTMVSVGEASGEVSRAFSEAYRFFQRDVDDILDSITVFLEPALVIVLGVGIAFVVAGILLPIYNLVLIL